jgi:hypothetical protein
VLGEYIDEDSTASLRIFSSSSYTNCPIIDAVWSDEWRRKITYHSSNLQTIPHGKPHQIKQQRDSTIYFTRLQFSIDGCSAARFGTAVRYHLPRCLSYVLYLFTLILVRI